MAYCKNCGNALYDVDKFCRRCGMKVEIPSVAPPPPMAGYQQPPMTPQQPVGYQQQPGYQQMPPQQPTGFPQQPPMGNNPYGSDVMASEAEGEIVMRGWQPQDGGNMQNGNTPSDSGKTRQIIGKVLIGVSILLLGVGAYSLFSSLGKKSADTEIQTSSTDSTATAVSTPETQPTEKPAEPVKPAEPEPETGSSVVVEDNPTPPAKDAKIKEEPQPQQEVTTRQQRSGESIVNSFGPNTDEEARALVRKMQAKGDITPEEAADCMRYINSRGSIGQ